MNHSVSDNLSFSELFKNINNFIDKIKKLENDDIKKNNKIKELEYKIEELKCKINKLENNVIGIIPLIEQSIDINSNITNNINSIENNLIDSIKDFDKHLITNEIYCDGACNSHTKIEGWGSVINSEGKDILNLENTIDCLSGIKNRIEKLPVGSRRVLIANFDDVTTQNNNGAELLALLAALRIAIKHPIIKVINCDSELLVKWWSLGHVKKKTSNSMDKAKFNYIKECENLRKIFESRGGQIIKISGNENIADLGWH
jgi:ribonuclease HI